MENEMLSYEETVARIEQEGKEFNSRIVQIASMCSERIQIRSRAYHDPNIANNLQSNPVSFTVGKFANNGSGATYGFHDAEKEKADRVAAATTKLKKAAKELHKEGVPYYIALLGDY